MQAAKTQISLWNNSNAHSRDVDECEVKLWGL